jgi:hypothetical protein
MQPVSEFADTFKVKQDVPLVGGMSAADFTGLKGAFGLADDASYGKYPIRGASLQTAKVDPRVIDAMGIAGALMPVAKNVGKAALREGARQIETGTGIGRAALNPRMEIVPNNIPKFPKTADTGLLKRVQDAKQEYLKERDLPPIKENHQRIFRGSHQNEPTYKVGDYFDGDDSVGAFGSSDLGAAKSHGDGGLHFTDIPQDKVLTHYDLNYNLPYEEVKAALLKERPDLKNDPELFDEVYNIVIGDAGQDLRSFDEDFINKAFGMSNDDGGAGWEAQRIRGQVSKNLGYKAIEMVDEHGGGTYLVSPGAEFKTMSVPKFPKTDGEIRSEIAQRNAALPISEGGLGLPANNMPMDRAGAMGWDTPAYHGTDKDIKEFYPNTFFTTNPKSASSYAEERASNNFGENANVIPLLSNVNKVANSDDVINAAKRAKVYDDDVQESYMYTSPNIDNLSEMATPKVISELKKQGFDSAEHYDFDMNDSPIKSLQIFNPANIRSRFAAFDPFRRHEADILAGVGIGGMLDPEAVSEEFRKKERK